MKSTLYKNFLWKDSSELQQLRVRDGIVVARGAELPEEPGIEIVDKSGYRLYPSFVDNHCHVLPTGLDLAKLTLEPAYSREEALELLHKRHKDQPDGWLLAVHYDQNRYGGHLTVDDLDAISTARPIGLRHANGHAGVANSKALELAGISNAIADEQGATYCRDASGKLNGVLLEHALDRVTRSIPKPTLEEMVQAILAATDSMAEWNISLTSDMHTGFFGLIDELNAYRIAAERGAKVAMRLYLQWSRVFGPKAPSREELAELVDAFDGDRCRVQGIKLFADGAIGSGTAAIYGSYSDEQPGNPTSGTLIYKPEVLKSRIGQAAAAGWQVSVHSIGDYATDLVMEGFEATEEPSRHRIEHAMLLSDQQIARMSKIGCRVSVQTEFLPTFGNTYRIKLGEERAWNLIRFKSLVDAGLRVSLSSDRPITTGEPTITLEMASNRPTGFNPDENLTRTEALNAYTALGAEATDDMAAYGSLDLSSPARLNWITI